jgi:hypothetical protein
MVQITDTTVKKKKSGIASWYYIVTNKLEKERKMNSPRTKQHPDFYRDKPHIPTQSQCLQKSCFLAGAPLDNCIFVHID